MLVADIIKDFDRHHAEHNSRATRDFYSQGLAWLRRSFGESDWEALDRLKVKDALRASYHWPDGRPMAPATHRRNKVAFAQLQKHAIDQEFTKREVLTKKDLRKPGSGRREFLPTDDEFDRILAAATPRFALAIRGFRACGMRPGELCRATVEQIKTTAVGVRAIVLVEHKTAKKTGKPRTIAIGEQLAEVVGEAIGDRTEGLIWRDEKDQPWTPDKLSARWRSLRRKLGLPEGRPLYTIRHYVGTWVTRTADIHVAMNLLGHTNINMTQRYAHGDETDQIKGQTALGQRERAVREPF